MTLYPEAVNWFLLSFAQPLTLALPQNDIWKGIKADGETVEDLSHHLRELWALCSKIEQEGTMKQQRITGLSDHLRMDAHEYNRQTVATSS